MKRQFFLDLAASGLAMPVGADLVLHEHHDHQAILHDGRQLGRVLAETAQRFKTPLALPVMDLKLEKAAMLSMLDIPASEIDAYHFVDCPGDETVARIHHRLADASDSRLQANIDAIKYTRRYTDLIPVGMTIGPFSLMTKLLADPITPLFMAGSGVSAEEDAEVRLVERVLDLSTLVILRSMGRQIEAGAKVMFIAEPAANIAYLSPNQIDAGSDVFDRYVMKYNQRLKFMMNSWGVELFFHCCGELTPYMVRKFALLDPAVLSLGCSRKPYEDCHLVPRTTVMYGNLPSKRFYSDDLCTVEQVRQMAADLRTKMEQTGHPFILGSECDILSVPGSEKQIMAKVLAMIESGAARRKHSAA